MPSSLPFVVPARLTGWNWRTSVSISRPCSSAVRTPTLSTGTSPASGSATFMKEAGSPAKLQAATSTSVSYPASLKSNYKNRTLKKPAHLMFLAPCRHFYKQPSVSHRGARIGRLEAGREKHLDFSHAETEVRQSQKEQALPSWTHSFQGLQPLFFLAVK